LARELDFHAGLLSLGALRDSDEQSLVNHCREVAKVIPLFGFYLQPAVGGRVLPYTFWRQLATIDNLAAIKIAPFNRYHTLEVIRAIADSGRTDIALYTGNDDNIVLDLLTTYRFTVHDRVVHNRMVGGLLGQWAVGTQAACRLLRQCHSAIAMQHSPLWPRVAPNAPNTPDLSGCSEAGAHEACFRELLSTAVAVTDMNAAIFDAANNFAGCIPGIHEVLRRQGLLECVECLDPRETLSPCQADEIDRVCRQYPDLGDDTFIQQHLERWLAN
jgi:dihydrodipicolinate synthase/N-acetylneuraminate lyase